MKIDLDQPTTEEKFKKIAKYLESFSRKLHKSVIFAVPPVPLLHSVLSPEMDGTIYHFISPMTGTISQIAISSTVSGATQWELGIEVSSKVEKSLKKYLVVKKVELFPCTIPVAPGDIVRVWCDPFIQITNILLGLQIDPVIHEAYKQQVLLSSILEIATEDAAL